MWPHYHRTIIHRAPWHHTHNVLQLYLKLDDHEYSGKSHALAKEQKNSLFLFIILVIKDYTAWPSLHSAYLERDLDNMIFLCNFIIFNLVIVFN